MLYWPFVRPIELPWYQLKAACVFLYLKDKLLNQHQWITLCLVCMLWISHTTYFTILNNALTAEISWSCFLVMFSRWKSHVASKAVFGHDRKVAQLKSIYMIGTLFIMLILTVAPYYVCSLQLEIVTKFANVSFSCWKSVNNCVYHAVFNGMRIAIM